MLFLIFLIPALERIFFTFGQREKDGAVKYIWTSISLISSYIFCVSMALFEFFIRKKGLIISISIIGFIFIWGGIILRRLSIKALGNNWSIHIKDIPGQQLIRTGPYKWVRHPYYLAVILELGGTALYFNSFLSLGYLVLIHLPLLLARITLEERNLAAQFQNQYQKYRRETGMFFPKVSLSND